MPKIASMLTKAIECEQPVLPTAAGAQTGRFARNPGEYSLPERAQLTPIHAGVNNVAGPELETTS